MPRVFLGVLLLLAATFARAEWVRLGENAAAVIYVDPATLEIRGDVRRILTLNDVKWSRGDNVVSFTTLDDYNCKENRRRTVFRESYAGPMATGKVIDSGRPTLIDFENVFAYTPGAWQLEYVCKQP